MIIPGSTTRSQPTGEPEPAGDGEHPWPDTTTTHGDEE